MTRKEIWKLLVAGERGSAFSSPHPFELLCWAVAIACASWLIVGLIQARGAMVEARSIGNSETAAPVESALVSAQGATDNLLPSGTKILHGDGEVIGRLEIAKVGLDVPVLENYDPNTLKRGVGHIPGTAAPGGLGNLGLAGHRDTFLRPLRNVKPGMEIDVVTADGRYRYRIDSFEIVTPDQVRVLDIRSQPELTLITCYPFNFIGAAPKRFIVHAHLLSLDPG